MSSPFRIDKRPFSVEPLTGMMLPDGIFDTCLKRQLLSVYVVNSSENRIDSFWARVRLSSNCIVTGPPEISVRYSLATGAATLLQWEVDVTLGVPGKIPISIEVGGISTDASGNHLYWDGRTDAIFFLASTTYDDLTRLYTCTIPEGSISIFFENSMQSSPSKTPGGEIKIPAVQFPQRFTAVVSPQGLVIPFDDPWWKVLAVLIAFLAAVGSLIEAAEGHGEATIGIVGHQHDQPLQYEWCTPDPTALAGPNSLTPAGALSAIATTAMFVALSDTIDPWERGRIAAVLRPGETPQTESVYAVLDYPKVMIAGTKYNVGVHWSYNSKLSSGRTTTLVADEVQPSSHLVKWTFDAPQESLVGKPIVVKVRGTRPDSTFFKSDELYGFSIFIAPDGKNSFRVPLLDDGRLYDSSAGDGWYTSAIVIENLLNQVHFDPIGEWRVEFVVQDVNDATQNMPPKIAATHIGGVPLLTPLIASQDEGKLCAVNQVISFIVKYFP
jgi:hypothetical protein